MNRFFSPILKIKSSEWPRAALAFSYFFLVITSYYIIKPLRDSLFIGQHGAANLPKAKLLTFFVLSVLVLLMIRLLKFLRKDIYLSSCVTFSVIVLIAFWWLGGTPRLWIAYAFYVWVSIYSVLNVSLFWTSATDIFDVQEAKRLFGFVGSGGILGSAVGSYLTSRLALVMGTRNLMLLAAFMLSFCVLIINMLWSLKRAPERGTTIESEISPIDSRPGATWRTFSEIFKDRYLFIVLTLFTLAKMVSTIVDYQFKNLVDVLPQDQLTVFFADYNMQISIVSFVIQFFLTSLILRKFGVIAALFLLPIGVGTGSLGILAHPELWVGRVTSIYDKGMSYSLNQTTREVLYLPVNREIRYRVKPVIDMVGFRLADAIANALILFLTRRLTLDIRQLSSVSLSFVGIWLFAIIIMRGDYRTRLRTYLARGSVVEKGNLVSRSMVRLFGSLLEAIGKVHQKDQWFLMRSINLARDPAFAERARQAFGESTANGSTVNGLLEHERRARSFDDEMQDLMEKGQVEKAAVEMACIMRFRTRWAKKFADEMKRSPYASLRLAGILASAAYGDGADRAGIQDVLDRALQDVRRETEEENEAVREVARRHAPSEDLAGRFLDLVRSKTKEEIERHASWLAGGQWVIEALKDCINDQRLGMEIRYGLPLVFSLIPTQDSAEALQKMLEHRNSTVRFRALKALNKLRAASPHIVMDQPLVEYVLSRTVGRWRSAYETMMVYQSYCLSRNMQVPHEDKFIRAHELRLDDLEERVFRLLGLICDCEESFQIYNALQQTDAQLRANALELLEHIVPLRLKTTVLSILERDRDELERPDLKEREAGAHIRAMLSSESRWNGLSALTVVVRFDLNGFDEEIRSLTEYKDPILRYIARVIAEEFSIDYART